jgi:hypothetical protein
MSYAVALIADDCYETQARVAVEKLRARKASRTSPWRNAQAPGFSLSTGNRERHALLGPKKPARRTRD